MRKDIPVLLPGEAVTLKLVVKVMDTEAMNIRGDKWWTFWRPTLWRDVTAKDLEPRKKRGSDE